MTFECATAFGAVGIQAALCAGQGIAWLDEEMFSFLLFNFQAHDFHAVCFMDILEFNILKNRAIATETTVHTDGLRQRCLSG